MITCHYTHHGKNKSIFRNRMSFPNGWTVSWVAAEPTAPARLYAQHHSGQWEDLGDEQFATTQEFQSVEVAIFNPQEELVPFKSGDTVKGWVTAAELVQILMWASQQTNTKNSVTVDSLTEKWYGHLNPKTTTYTENSNDGN